MDDYIKQFYCEYNKIYPNDIKHENYNICCDHLLIQTEWSLTCSNCGKIFIDKIEFANEYNIKNHNRKAQYKKISHLFNKIKQKNIYLSENDKQRINKYFNTITASFLMLKKTRKNFLNYEYLLQNILKKLNINYKCDFKILKNVKTQYEHNKIWNLICG